MVVKVVVESGITGILNIDLKKVLIIVAYDLPSEGKIGITEGECKFLSTTRKSFTNNLYDLGCSPIQQSVWRVPQVIPPAVKKRYPYITEVGIVEEVQRRVANFKEKYAQGWTDPDTSEHKGYLKNTRMEVLPIAMSDEGYDIFVGMQVDGIYNWMGKLISTFDGWIEEGATSSENIKRWLREIHSIEDGIEVFFGPGAEDFTQERYDHLKESLVMTQNAYQELLDTVKVIEKKKK